MAETLIAMEENPLEKYLEDETGIVEKVQKFLDGEMFDELHNKVMDYGAITIEPKSTTSTNMSTTGSTTGTAGNSGDSSVDSSSSSSGTSSNASTPRGVGYVHRATPQPTARAIARHRRPLTIKEKIIARNPLAKLFLR